MAQKPPVHVELREGEWTVLREGNERATSVYPTQSEAAEVGRELARRAKTEFFLHARDGHGREHRSYEEEVVVEKRPVVKEEIRVRKDVGEETEIVEEDVRREEIDVDDQGSTR